MWLFHLEQSVICEINTKQNRGVSYLDFSPKSKVLGVLGDDHWLLYIVLSFMEPDGVFKSFLQGFSFRHCPDPAVLSKAEFNINCYKWGLLWCSSLFAGRATQIPSSTIVEEVAFLVRCMTWENLGEGCYSVLWPPVLCRNILLLYLAAKAKLP